MSELTPRGRRERDDRALIVALSRLGIERPEATAEWEAVFTLLRGGWPGVLSETETVSYLTLLDDLTAEQVIHAVRHLHKTGATFRPRPSEVRAAHNDNNPERGRLSQWQNRMLAFARRNGAGKAIEYFDPDRGRIGEWPPAIRSAYSAKIAGELQQPTNTPEPEPNE